MRKPKLRIVIRRKSTVPKNVRGQFFNTQPEVWTRRRLCPRCRIRKCEIPVMVEHVISPTGICHHCICWEASRHCCWCGRAHVGGTVSILYKQFINRLIELGCVKCEQCHNYVSVPHALHPEVNPQPKITNRNREVTNASHPNPASSTKPAPASPPSHKHNRPASKPKVSRKGRR